MNTKEETKDPTWQLFIKFPIPTLLYFLAFGRGLCKVSFSLIISHYLLHYYCLIAR